MTEHQNQPQKPRNRYLFYCIVIMAGVLAFGAGTWTAYRVLQ